MTAPNFTKEMKLEGEEAYPPTQSDLEAKVKATGMPNYSLSLAYTFRS